MPMLMTIGFTCRLVLIRLMRSLPWNAKKDIRTWMPTDKLKLNDDKTEFLLIGKKRQLSKVNIDSLAVGSIDFAPVPVVRNLGT